MLYTGGTTGLPKGVVWRQEDIFFARVGRREPRRSADRAARRASRRRCSTTRRSASAPFLAAGDPGPAQFVSLALGPLMHASGQWSALGTLLGGGKVVLYDEPHVDMEHVLDLVERERVGTREPRRRRERAAAARRRCAAHPDRWDTSSLRLLGSGGSILSGDVKDALLARDAVRARDRRGHRLVGVARAGGRGHDARRGRRRGRSRSRRRPRRSSSTTTCSRSPPGSGVVGRLATRGRVPLGYYKDPERAARTFVEIDGERWSLPGDMATIDADGTVHLLGRGSLCINTGGEKVYPEEVEAVLKTHPQVVDAVVVGLPDPTWGERVVAIVQPAEGGDTLTLEALGAALPGIAGGLQGAARCCVSSTASSAPTPARPTTPGPEPSSRPHHLTTSEAEQERGVVAEQARVLRRLAAAPLVVVDGCRRALGVRVVGAGHEEVAGLALQPLR